MTTIAWDGNTLAVDRGSWSGYLVNTVCKLFDVRGGGRIKNQAYFAACGDAHVAMATVKWLRGEEIPPFADPEAWKKSVGVVVSLDKRIYRICPGILFCEEEILSVPFADGGGGEIALGAMLAGASAARAVKIVAQRSSLSYGGVDSVKIR